MRCVLMDCEQVVERIDVLPFVDDPPLRLAVETHCESCENCRAALAEARALEASLAGLTEPEPSVSSPDLLDGILRRIEDSHRREVESRQAAEMADAAKAAKAAEAVASGAVRTPGRARALAAVLVGFALSLGAFAYQLMTGDVTLSVVSSPLDDRSLGLTGVPEPGVAVLALAVGLWLYLLGLFGSVAPPERVPGRQSSTSRV